MKEITRIITVQLELTEKNVNEDDMCSIERAISVLKRELENHLHVTYVNITDAKDFIKDE